MDAESTDWYREAAEAVLRPLGDAESHFDTAYSGRKKTALSEACDRLSSTARQAESWSAGHPCLPRTLIFTSGTASRFVAGSWRSYLLCPFDQTLETEWISKWRIFNTGSSGTVTPSQPGRLNN
jgi:hypothetical protein